MMRRLVVVVALLMAVVLTTALVPRRAAASDNLQYIIPVAASGALALVLVIAILMADRKGDTELELIAGNRPLPESRPGVHLAPHCRPTNGGIPLLCW